MLEVKATDGTIFDPYSAYVRIQPEGSETEYGWSDILVVGMLAPTVDQMTGLFAPPGAKGGMPIRGLRFTDPSGFTVEVPMPVDYARDLGKALAEEQIEVVRSMPSGLLLRQAAIEQRVEDRRRQG